MNKLPYFSFRDDNWINEKLLYLRPEIKSNQAFSRKENLNPKTPSVESNLKNRLKSRFKSIRFSEDDTSKALFESMINNHAAIGKD